MMTLALAAPERDAKRLAALFNERLARVTLPAPAITLALTVDELHPFAPAMPACCRRRRTRPRQR
jgi:protein ImuB